MGVGVFFGASPFWGYQTWLALGVAFIFRLNKLIVLLASNISFPPMNLVLMAASLFLGRMLFGEEPFELVFEKERLLQLTLEYGMQFFLGGFVIASVLASLFSGITYIVLKNLRKELK